MARSRARARAQAARGRAQALLDGKNGLAPSPRSAASLVGWQGPRAPSNTCFAWFVWDEQSEQKRIIDWFDWKPITSKRGKEDLFGGPDKKQRAVA
jgi:hypothetical protein